MEEYTITLTKADVWELLGCMEVSYSESVCFWDRSFEDELGPHVNTQRLEDKLKEILYGKNQSGEKTPSSTNDREGQ